jgi:hypothetical protein
MSLDEVEKSLEPKRLIRILISLFVVLVVIIALVKGLSMAAGTMDKVEASSRDHAWFKATYEEIHALEHQIVEVRDAAMKHQAQVDSRWVSRQDDRVETQRLAHHLIELTERRAGLIREYNISADAADPETLGDLPKVLAATEEGHHEPSEN